jgi:hypothetical protein
VLANHPFVTDIDEEIANIEADEQQYLDMGGVANGTANSTDLQKSGSGVNKNKQEEGSGKLDAEGDNKAKE